MSFTRSSVAITQHGQNRFQGQLCFPTLCFCVSWVKLVHQGHNYKRVMITNPTKSNPTPTVYSF